MIRVLQIIINPQELYDEEKEQFVNVEECVLNLEHSLISVAKWESKWEIPFLSDKSLTFEQQMDYIRCMTLNEMPEYAYQAITSKQRNDIFDYIKKKMTATVIKQHAPFRKNDGTFITAEIIYWWMTALQIPFDPCEKWHLNRLLALIEVASIKSQPPKKMGKKSTMAQNASINKARCLAMGTRG